MSSAIVIDGKAQAKVVRDNIARDVKDFSSTISLAVILVGDDPASAVYVRNKIKACEVTGIKSIERRLPKNASYQDVASTIESLNNDPDVNGILLQLPLPDHLDSGLLIEMISPAKDVDGLTYSNIGRLVAGASDTLVPCTPQGSLHLIKTVSKDLTGQHAVIIGRSLLFGKPMAQLLLAQNCTVTQAHSKTRDLPEIASKADILIAAVGRPKMVKRNWIKDGAIVIDVGINRGEDGKLCGDVDFDEAKEVASAITPVPGGVGPMTIAFLLKNTLSAARSQINASK